MRQRVLRKTALLAILSILGLFHPGRLHGAEIKHFKLGGPLLIQADWSSEFLRWGDLNADGRLDFMTVNNRKSIIQIFYQTQDPNKPFHMKKWFIEHNATDAVVLDLNQDRRDDIALAGNPCRILYQGKDGTFAQAEDLNFNAQYLLPTDLDNDGRADLLGIGRRELVLALCAKGTGKAKFDRGGGIDVIKQPGVHAPKDRPFIADFNGDGLPDLAFISATNRDLLVLRYRNREIRFNPERTFKIGFNRTLASLAIDGPKTLLAAVDEKTETAKIMAFENVAFESDSPFRFDDLQSLPFAAEAPSGKERFLLCDLQGKGRAQLYHVSSDSPELKRFRINSNGSAIFDSFPVFTGISKIRDFQISRHGPRRLLLVSPKEQAIGWVQNNPDGTLSVPHLFDTGKSPLAADIGDMDRDGFNDLVVAVKRRAVKGKPDFLYFPGTRDNDFLSSPVSLRFKDKAPADSELSDLTVGDVNRDGRLDLILFPEYGPPRIFGRLADSDIFAPLLQTALQRGFFSQVKPANLKFLDFNGDGKNEIVLLSKPYARVLSMNPKGEIKLLAQFNGKNAKAELTGLALEDLDKAAGADGEKEVILLDRGNKCLTLYRRNEPQKILDNVDLETPEAENLLTGDLNDDKHRDLVLTGSGNAGLMLGDVPPLRIKTLSRHSTDIEDGGYFAVYTTDLNGDGEDELLVYEKTKHLLEFFQFVFPGTWRRVYKFLIFEGEGPGNNPFRGPGFLATMPRQIDAVDYNNDGKADLVMLIHNLIILYPRSE